MANILLTEPGYRNKYPPLGLMKISAYHRSKGDHLVFAKGIRPELLKSRWDRVYVTTLFSFEFKRIAEQIDFAIECASQQTRRVFVGGIAASLMTEAFLDEPRWYGVRFISGLLNKSPAESLQLDEFEGDLYAEDTDSIPIEDNTPDYSILKDIESYYSYPVQDAYFGYASRGCIRSCKFCGVPRLEGGQRDAMPVIDLISRIKAEHGEKRDLILMDNNVTASARYKELIAEIRDAGFQAGATIERNGRPIRRRVDFNQGVDARILCKERMYLREMSSICISPLRIAFDHLGLFKVYSQAIRYASEFGINQLSNYMLYNFHDSPEDLFSRLRINIDLNRELGIRIWSFPMRYQPITLKDRSHVGSKWTWYWLRSFQVILQATHGVVTGNPVYFDRAFGSSQEKFMQLLNLPHHMIFHRDYYELHEGKAEREECESLMKSLGKTQKQELHESLASFTSSGYQELGALTAATKDRKLRHLLELYRSPDKDMQRDIQAKTEARKLEELNREEEVPIEDAGLYEDEPAKQAEDSEAPAAASWQKKSGSIRVQMVPG